MLVASIFVKIIPFPEATFQDTMPKNKAFLGLQMGTEVKVAQVGKVNSS